MPSCTMLFWTNFGLVCNISVKSFSETVLLTVRHWPRNFQLVGFCEGNFGLGVSENSGIDGSWSDCDKLQCCACTVCSFYQLL